MAPRLLGPWDFPGKRTRVGCHFLLQILGLAVPNMGVRKVKQIPVCAFMWRAAAQKLLHTGFEFCEEEAEGASGVRSRDPALRE